MWHRGSRHLLRLQGLLQGTTLSSSQQEASSPCFAWLARGVKKQANEVILGFIPPHWLHRADQSPAVFTAALVAAAAAPVV